MTIYTALFWLSFFMTAGIVAGELIHTMVGL
jgi:predicted membrane metal-binding protein